MRALVVGCALAGCGGAGAAGPNAQEPVGGATEHAGAVEHEHTAPKEIQGTSAGMSCEEAKAQNVEEVDMEGNGPADLTSTDYGQVLNAGTYLEACNVPRESKVDLCVAVRNGAAVGVTVALEPRAPDLEMCVADRVKALSFPSHPKLDIARVRF